MQTNCAGTTDCTRLPLPGASKIPAASQEAVLRERQCSNTLSFISQRCMKCSFYVRYHTAPVVRVLSRGLSCHSDTCASKVDLPQHGVCRTGSFSSRCRITLLQVSCFTKCSAPRDQSSVMHASRRSSNQTDEFDISPAAGGAFFTHICSTSGASILLRGRGSISMEG